MSFVDLFAGDVEPEEPPEPPVEHERPVWLGPPDGELAIPVPLGVILGRSERGVIAVSHALAYSTGVSFALVAHVDSLTPNQSNAIFHEQHAGRLGLDDLPDGFLRFGVELADGQRASNLGGRHAYAKPDESPRRPVLFQHGGGGGHSHANAVTWNLAFWLWPLPPAGALRLFCEWPVAEIGLSHVAVETGPILESAERAVPLWDGDGAAGAATSSAGHHVMTASASAARPEPPGDTDDETVAVPRAQLRALEDALQSALHALRRAAR